MSAIKRLIKLVFILGIVIILGGSFLWARYKERLLTSILCKNSFINSRLIGDYLSFNLRKQDEALTLIVGEIMPNYLIALLEKNTAQIAKEKEQVEKSFQQLELQFPAFEEIKYVDLKGQELIKVTENKVIKDKLENISKNNLLKPLFKGKTLSKYNSKVFSISDEEGKQKLCIYMCKLVELKMASKKIQGYLVAKYNLSDLQSLINPLPNYLEEGFPWIIVEIEGKAKVIASPPEYKYSGAGRALLVSFVKQVGKQILKEREGWLTYKEYLFSFTPVKESPDWIVVVTSPLHKFKWVLYKELFWLDLLLVLSFGLTLILLYVYSQKHIQQVQLLQAEANRLLKDTSYHRIGINFTEELEEIKNVLNEFKGKVASLYDKVFPDVNPLTGLPGSLTLEKKLFELIDSQEKFAVVRVDIDNFHSYNKYFGFVRGDSVIRFLGMLIVNKVKELGNTTDLVAHLGGDDFIFTTTPDKLEEIINKVMNEFNLLIPYFYDEKERQAGFILSKDKDGNINKFNFLTLSLSISTNEKRKLIHPLQINQILGEVLGYIKKQGGNKWFKDRRREDRKPLPEEVIKQLRDTGKLPDELDKGKEANKEEA